MEEFRLKCTKFKHVDQLVRDNSSLTRSSLAKTLKNALLWDILSISTYSKHQFPKTSAHKGFFHRGHFSFCPLEPPSWILHGEPPDEIGRLLRVRNLCLLYLCLLQLATSGFRTQMLHPVLIYRLVVSPIYCKPREHVRM